MFFAARLCYTADWKFPEEVEIMEDHKPVRLSRTPRYESNWVSVFTDRVQFPTGKIVEKFHILEYSSEAAAAVIENDAGEVLLARVYRYPTDRLEWEIPGGRIDPGETPILAGQREALEETGWETSDARLLYTFYPTNGISSQRFHVIYCRASRRVGEFDRDEIQKIRWFTKDEIRKMIAQNSMVDGFTLTALLLWMNESPSANPSN